MKEDLGNVKKILRITFLNGDITCSHNSIVFVYLGLGQARTRARD